MNSCSVINLLVLLLLIGSVFTLQAQNSNDSFTDYPVDSNKRNFKRLDVFPAVSYSPETKLTLGAIGYYYMDLSRGKPKTSISNVNFLAIYTTANQVAIEAKAELFFPGNKWRLRGEAFYNHYPDRNYGSGNDASVVLMEFRGKEGDLPDTVNYLSVNTDRIKFAPVLIRELKTNIYLGIQSDVEYLFNYRSLYPHQFISGDSTLITQLPVNGLRSGIGFQFLYDSRDFILNPISGYYIEAGNLHYGKLTFSDFRFHSYRLDARAYINPVLNHTIAIRSVLNYRHGSGPYSLRGYGRIGGKDFIRGYFQGTYQDRTLVGFELEYRLPFWKEDNDSKLWQLWKRLGIVVFVGTAQVANIPKDLRFNRFRTGVGGGLRILFSKESRVNLRIDYAIGLAGDSNGPEKRQSGLYFYLGEAF